MGVLNEILFSHEKEGNVRPQQYMQAFHDTLDDCGLTHLGYVGDLFTWHRGNIRERLGRASEWNSMYVNAAVIHCDYYRSDHRPLLLDTDFYSVMGFVA